MKTGSATRKVPGGKLLRIDVQGEERIKTVKLTGDFFLHPEEVLDKIISVLTGQPIPVNAAQTVGLVEAVLAENQAQLIGISAEDIVQTLLEALK